MRFIACYENTPPGVSALKLSQQHARIWQADLEVVSTLTRDEPIRHNQLKEIEEQMESEVRSLVTEPSLNVRFSLLTDELEAGEQIVKFAERKKADLIFLGIKKKSRVGKILFGSTAQYIVINAPCPVVTAHSHTN